MPEGPEIKKVAQSIERRFLNTPLTALFFKFSFLKSYEEELEGQSIVRVDSKGKALLIHFNNDWVMYSHNQLYGKWFIKKNGQDPKTNRDLRVKLQNKDYSAFLYSASDIDVLHKDDLAQHSYLVKLGLDVFDSYTDKEVIDYLYTKKFLNRWVGNLLLDQEFIAGMGNYLRSEALFFSKIHPYEKLKALSKEQVLNLYRTCQRLSLQSLEHRGVTNDLKRAEGLKQKGFSRRKYRHAVFTRVGENCYACRAKIEKINVASRRLYYCPRCQS
ncbi:endonuclease VIII [bacterium]|nr:endonuclease VIII [bacterium]